MFVEYLLVRERVNWTDASPPPLLLITFTTASCLQPVVAVELTGVSWNPGMLLAD